MVASSEVVAPVVPPPASTRLRRGAVLWVLRAGAVAMAAWFVTLFLVALHARYIELLRISLMAQRSLAYLSPEDQAAFRSLGISLDAYPAFALGIEIVVVAGFAVSSLIVLLRRSDDWMALFMVVAPLGYLTHSMPALDALAGASLQWRPVVHLAEAVGFAFFNVFFYLFPNGRFVPGWTRYLAWFWIASPLLLVIAPRVWLPLMNPFRIDFSLFLIICVILAVNVSVQVYRYRYIATPIQRQQTKWMLVAVFISVITYVAYVINPLVLPPLDAFGVPSLVYFLTGVLFFLLSLLLVSTALTFSILRYRLWDIDSIINRAVVYGVLTAILGGLYITSIGLSQRMFVALTGETSDAAIVVTTLVVASAFTPVRSELQKIVDTYVKDSPDPAKRIGAFIGQVRSGIWVVDRSKLVRRGLQEAIEAFRATGGAVYLVTGPEPELVHSAGEWQGGAAVSVPVAAGQHTLGQLVLGTRVNGAPYSESDRNALHQLAGFIGQHLGPAPPG